MHTYLGDNTGECLLMSSLPSNLEAESGKRDIKRREPVASSTMRALSTARCTDARLYFDLYVLGDDAWIS